MSLLYFEHRNCTVWFKPYTLMALHTAHILQQIWYTSAFCCFCAANAKWVATLPRYPTPPSEQIRGWPLKPWAVNSTIFSTSSTVQDKFTIERPCSFCEPSSVLMCRWTDVACLTRSSLVREHMQSQTGAMKTVNKGPWHHLDRQEEHVFSKSQDPRGNLRHTLAAHKLSGAIYSYQIGYIAIGVTPPCPAILDRQPAINVTCNVCQLVHTDSKWKTTRHVLK